MIGAFLEITTYLIFRIIIEVFIIGTGEIVLYCATLGKRKPVWKRDFAGASAKLALLIDLSFIIGAVFWIGLTWLLFSR